MGCDYYIRTELIIEFYDKDNKHCCIYTNMKFKKGYIFSNLNKDSDDDKETQGNKFQAELERIIKEILKIKYCLKTMFGLRNHIGKNIIYI